MIFDNRRWIFLNSEDIDKVNFKQLPLVQSEPYKPTSVRYNNGNSMFMLRYDIQESSGVITGRPDCYDLALTINGKIEWYHEEVVEYLATSEWVNIEMFPID
jgi:hypothetical protein